MASKNTYFQAVGRRKTSVARVRLTPSEKSVFDINGKDLVNYFQTIDLQNIINDAFKASGIMQAFNVTIKVLGGGIHSQAEAVRHGVARALVSYDINLKTAVKKAGFLKRDARQVERKKPGLKKARKSPTWSKR
jgi:small subunit ribosomal protein S9